MTNDVGIGSFTLFCSFNQQKKLTLFLKKTPLVCLEILNDKGRE